VLGIREISESFLWMMRFNPGIERWLASLGSGHKYCGDPFLYKPGLSPSLEIMEVVRGNAETLL
jgi:hypothetical protein